MAPLSVFFGIVRLFSQKKFSPPFNFFDVLQQWMLKNAKRSPFLVRLFGPTFWVFQVL